MPHWKGIFAYLGIIAVVVLVVFVPAEKLIAFMGRPLWSSPELGAKSADVSSAVVWLVMANASSIIAVWLLWRELRAVVKAAQGIFLTRRTTSSRAGAYEVPSSVTDEQLTNYVLDPLGRISAISIAVLLVTVGLSVALFVFGAGLPESVFTVAIIWTGFAYVLAMTLCDLAARKSFRMLCSLELADGDTSNPSRKAAMKRSHQELLETLADFDRMIYYVDVPVLLGVSIILIHKFVVLEKGPYYLGFVAGAIAMHTILANIISLSIAASQSVSISEAP